MTVRPQCPSAPHNRSKRAEDALAERNAQLSPAGKAALVGTYVDDFDADRIRSS
jgi:hypothetical protein